MSEQVELKTPGSAWSLQKAIDAFFERNFAVGEIVTHEWLEYHLNIPEPKTVAEAREIRWTAMNRVDAFKSELLNKHQICLCNVFGEGYRVVPPSEQARYAVQKTITQVTRAFEKGNNIIENTRIDALSDEERRRHTDAQNKMQGLQQIMTKEKRNIFLEFSK